MNTRDYSAWLGLQKHECIMIGYIKLHRQLLDSPSFKNAQEQMAFAWLILRAQWKDKEVRYKGVRLSLKRGQVALSYRHFAKEWGWSEAKCRRFIAKLSETKPKSNRQGSDAVVSASSDAGVCVITILNYNRFQDPVINDDAPSDALMNGEVTHQRRTSDAQNKEDNNIRNKEEVTEAISPSDISDLWNKICYQLKPVKLLSLDRENKIRNLAQGTFKTKDAWQGYFQMFTDSTFLRGESSNSFIATFDWALNPRNMVKVMDGNYEDRESEVFNPVKHMQKIIDEREEIENVN